MLHRLTKILRCNNGATSIEYAMIAAGIMLAIVTVVGLVGGGVQGLFTGVAGAF